MLPDRLVGGCQCGACRYEIASSPLFGYLCHCLECRKLGGVGSAAVLVPTDAISMTGPATSWLRDTDAGPPLEAVFCSTCGVRLLHHSVPRDGAARLRVGSLDDASWFRPAAEFFTKRRFAWFGVDGETIECTERAAAEDYAALLAAWQQLYAATS